MEQMQLFAGLDMHTESITGTIKDEQGNPVRVLKVETSKEGAKKLFERLHKKKISAVFKSRPTEGRREVGERGFAPSSF